MNKRTEQKSTGRRIVSGILIVALVVCFAGSGFFAVKYFYNLKDYADEESKFEEVRDLVVKPSDADNVSDADTLYPLYTVIDFDTLLGMNADATRWVCIPGTPINYPVMQERTVGKFRYLWEDINRRQSSTGTPLTPAIPLGIDDPHILLFGHSFSNNSNVGFTHIKDYFDRSFFNSHPYVYVYYPDRTEKWLAIESKNVMGSDRVYDVPYTYGSEDYKALQDYLFSKPYRQQLTTHIKGITENDPILILSTCDTRYDKKNGRAILICRLAEVLDRETMQVTQVYPAPAGLTTSVASDAARSVLHAD